MILTRPGLTALAISLLLCQPGAARHVKEICATSPERRKEEIHLHRQAERARRIARLASNTSQETAQPTSSRDVGNIAILENTDGVVARRNPFNLDNQTLTFTPSAAPASYKFQVGAGSYDGHAAASGTSVPLGDDDSHAQTLAFPFPFFGKTYQSVFINSDGNLTFGVRDDGSSDRSLGRLVAGPPRIAALFSDLDPAMSAKGVVVLSDATRFVVSWVQAPDYSDFGAGSPETFQVRLYPDGRVQIAYSGINTVGAVVGLSPGNFHGSSAVVSFYSGSQVEYSSTVAERFGGNTEIDIETATQKFFETHEDGYDYVAFFNDEDITAGFNAVAWEQTVRNDRSGYGDIPADAGAEYGSPSRLQAVINFGPLSQYPASPTDLVSLRAQSGYTPLKIIAHEVGHLFLAYASVRDPKDPSAQPMLGIQLAHWAFDFNAEASFMEGNRILDNGPSATPRYLTTAAVDTYSPLDQYLMGFRSASDVAPTFLVTGNPPSFAQRFPQVGATFSGDRREITVDDILQVTGRRTPDYTVAQRHFRIAFVLIVKKGTSPTVSELAQIESFRSQFESFYQQSTGGRAHMDASLRHALSLSIAPAAGVVAGGSIAATISVDRPVSSPLTISLQALAGNIATPPAVVIAPGETTANFAINGLRQGVEELTAVSDDPGFAAAYSHVQVLPQSALLLSTVSGDKQVMGAGGTIEQPVVVRVTDFNSLFYPGAQVRASASGGGVVTPAVATSDSHGMVSFQWVPGSTSGARLTVSLAGGPPMKGVSITALPPTTIKPAGVVNAASLTSGLSPGALATVYGTTLADGVLAQANLPWPTMLGDVMVRVNDEPARLLYVSDGQVNFVAPDDIAPGVATVTVSTMAGTSASLQVSVSEVTPGIFFDQHTSFGAILNAGTMRTTQQFPAPRGQYIEIYCTGLGAVQSNDDGLMVTVNQPQVFIGNVRATVTFSGLAPAYGGGLYQVNAKIPSNVLAGTQNIHLIVNGVSSNVVKAGIQ